MPPATSPTTSTGRRSPPRGWAAWRRWRRYVSWPRKTTPAPTTSSATPRRRRSANGDHEVVIREAGLGDHAMIRAVTEAAFDESRFDEAGIIEGVRDEGRVLVELVAEDDGEVVGHVLFSRMRADPPRAV